MKFFLLVVFTYFTILITGCGKSSQEPNIAELALKETTEETQKRVYGVSLNREIEIQSFQYCTLYMPTSIKSGEKLPIVLFAPGWSSRDHTNYKTLLTFIASQGYAVIYAQSPMEYSANESISRISAVLNDDLVSRNFDKSKLGVIGHSSGGGIAFKIMDYFSKKGYGNAGRFVFAMDPWFAFDMSAEDFKNFPKNTKVVIQQYNKHNTTDPRIALTIFDKLSILGDNNRDYQVYLDLDHGYPAGSGSYEQKQVILKPLDALMSYTFFEDQNAYKIALDIGSDNPYKENYQPVASRYTFDFRCTDDNEDLVLALKGLNYCSIIP